MTMPALPAIAACALLCLVLFAQVPGESLLAAELTNAAHGPAFALLTWLLFRIGRLGPLRHAPLLLQYSTVIGTALALGAAVEMLQAMLGRDASWDDLWRDAQGIVAATGWQLMRDPRLRGTGNLHAARLAGLALAVAGVAMIAWPPVASGLARIDRDRSFPVLADFDRPRAMHFVNPLGGATVEWAALPPAARAGAAQTHALRVSAAGRAWWGVTLREPVPDWRAYRSLCLTLSNPAHQSLTVELRLHDTASHTDAATAVQAILEIPPQSSRTYRLAFADLDAATDFDFAQVQSLMLARKGPRRDATEFYLARLWLE